MHQTPIAEPHNFDLAGMKMGDWFMGCPSCWNQYPKRAAGAVRCHCGGKMLLYEIQSYDLAEVAEHDRRRLVQRAPT